MGGYGFYVWTSYGLSAIVLVGNAVMARRRESSLLQEIAGAAAPGATRR
jgi:heme exporter protein D